MKLIRRGGVSCIPSYCFFKIDKINWTDGFDLTSFFLSLYLSDMSPKITEIFRETCGNHFHY